MPHYLPDPEWINGPMDDDSVYQDAYDKATDLEVAFYKQSPSEQLQEYLTLFDPEDVFTNLLDYLGGFTAAECVTMLAKGIPEIAKVLREYYKEDDALAKALYEINFGYKMPEVE
ncbi:hypothetical protein [Acinetobacter sp.]|uniref:hypothetical protein n=1 Tax=Acinetobacter sp. TaxID=472 RepID=UPI003D06C2E3